MFSNPVNHALIDEMLADFRPASGLDPAVTSGLRRGLDFNALSATADQGILDDLFGGGEHKSASAQTANRSGLVAANGNWRQSPAARRAQETTYDAKPFTKDDVEGGNEDNAVTAAMDDSIMGDVMKHASAEDPQSLKDLGKSYISPGDIKQFITTSLTLGQTPIQVFASLRRMAAEAVFDNVPMDAFLKDQSGLMGMAYIEPNKFNKDCKASLNHIRSNGVLRAASVKQIAACSGCSECKANPDGSKKCAVYNKPIVGNATELGRVVASLTGGTMKKADLVAKHNGSTAAPSTPGHGPNVIASRTAPVTQPKVAGNQNGISRFDSAEFRTANSTFTPAAVVASLNEGTSFARIFAAAKLEHGTQAAEKVCRAFLDTLKGSQQRVNLASLDCTLLKRRLASSETILGASKCASCTLRQGMHCGLTGGTLLSYPGMGQDSSSRRTAAMTPQVKDGVQSMRDLGMAEPELTIEFRAPRQMMDVDVPGIG
jgi:hypothetical protein